MPRGPIVYSRDFRGKTRRYKRNEKTGRRRTEKGSKREHRTIRASFRKADGKQKIKIAGDRGTTRGLFLLCSCICAEDFTKVSSMREESGL